MSDSRMKIPGPDHPIAIRPCGPVRVIWRGRTILRADSALIVKEAGLPEVVYFSREDADETFFSRSTRRTFCPYKGDASYFTLVHGGERDDNAVWSYPEPYPAMQQLAERIAFYADKVSVEFE